MVSHNKLIRKPKVVLVTGGMGFIGSNFIRYLLAQEDFKGKVVNLDKLTYAGNPDNLKDFISGYEGKRYFFEQMDICDLNGAMRIMEKYRIDTLVHFAAESHVDRSIYGPGDFIQTNIIGTFTLLEAARKYWQGEKEVLFHHVSTDEVYGDLGPEGYFYESSPYDPHSPYSASKASSDHLVRAYHHTYGLPVTISNCSNNFGPFQFPEKLIPLMILNAVDGKTLPVYGDGSNVRDWLYVEDHCAAIWQIICNSRVGETYNVAGGNEVQNIEIVHMLCDVLQEKLPPQQNTRLKATSYRELIEFVTDRPGHDRRYAVSFQKIQKELDWQPMVSLAEGFELTVQWYLANPEWVERVQSGLYQQWLDKNYKP